MERYRMKLSCLLAVILTLLTTASMAQPAGGGPGPGPTQPWIVNGNTISYPGQIISPNLVNPILSGLNGPVIAHGSSQITSGTLSGTTNIFMTGIGSFTN